MSAFTNLVPYYKPGGPSPSADFGGGYVMYEYIGPHATLGTNCPKVNDGWGPDGWPVSRILGPKKIYKSVLSELTIEIRSPDYNAVASVAASLAINNAEFPVVEIEELAVEKSLRKHPAFKEATVDMWVSMDAWLNEKNNTARAAFQYYNRNEAGTVVGGVQTLSTTNCPDKSMQDFAKLWLNGVESFTDYLPLARKTSLFYGQTCPITDAIGTKISGDPFSAVPSGYEWLLSSSRAQKQGRGFYWTLNEEWTGAIQILLDATTIYV